MTPRHYEPGDPAYPHRDRDEARDAEAASMGALAEEIAQRADALRLLIQDAHSRGMGLPLTEPDRENLQGSLMSLHEGLSDRSWEDWREPAHRRAEDLID